MKKSLIILLFMAISFTGICSDNSPVVIDYMVVYTPAAEESIGGEDAMIAKIESGVETVNAVLERSGLGHISYRLVHTQRLSGDNTSIVLQDAITEVFNLDPINDIRDEHFADSVSIIFERISPGAYGTIPTSASQAKRSFSYFGVANYGGLTTAHELGHNMGGFHNNPEPEPELRAYDYVAGYDERYIYAPYGYNFIGTNGVHYKTVMSADFFSPLDPEGNIILESCGYYSNPAIYFQGVPTGRTGYADMGSEISYWAPIIATTHTPPEIQPVYRFYSSGAPESTYTHLWTISESEKDVLRAWPSWIYEGVAWRAYDRYGGVNSGLTPLYRLYEPNIKRHLYTVDDVEYDYLTGYTTWQGEGAQYYVYPSNSVADLVPVYRFYHSVNQNHHFTIDQNEKDTIIATPEWGYTYEGEVFYVFETDQN